MRMRQFRQYFPRWKYLLKLCLKNASKLSLWLFAKLIGLNRCGNIADLQALPSSSADESVYAISNVDIYGD